MSLKLEAHCHGSAKPYSVGILSEGAGFCRGRRVRIYICPANAERQSANFIHAQNEIGVDADIAVAVRVVVNNIVSLKAAAVSVSVID